jgi:hypothetical protein
MAAGPEPAPALPLPVIVTVAVAGLPSVAPLAFDRVTVKFLLPLNAVALSDTLMDFAAASPELHVNDPAAAV